MGQKRFRIALAGLVAVACLSASLLLTAEFGNAPSAKGSHAARTGSQDLRHLEHVAQRVEAGQTSDGAPVRGVSEKDLRAVETATLGPEHAQEHAQNRAAEREYPAQVKAAEAAAAAPLPPDPDPPSEVGEWETKFKIPTFAIHAAMLPTGKVLWFSYQTFAQGGDAERNTSQAWLWDPVTKETTEVDPPNGPNGKPYNIWCSGHTFTEDGRLVVFGGNLKLQNLPANDYEGLNKVFTFNPWTEKWVEQPDMQHGRWYPSGVRLPDGTIPILSGLDEFGHADLNRDIELFRPSADRDAVDAAGRGTISLLGDTRTDQDDVTLPPTGEYYPHLFSMASGRMLVAGPEHQRDTWFLDSHDTSRPLENQWSEAPDMSMRRLWGTAVPLADDAKGPTKVMELGGKDYDGEDADGNTVPTYAVKSTEVFDETKPEIGWQPAPDMNIGRAHANTVLLPDGSMVEVGGGVGTRDPDDLENGGQYASDPDQRKIELWNPTTKTWKLGPPQAEPRAYHSTALLLPDATVISAGDDRGAKRVDGDTAEIYKPPYLFKGAQPTISYAPAATPLGLDFGVDTPDADDIKSAALVAPGSVTHAVDMNQRYLPVTVTKHSGCVDVESPPTPKAAPPGYYMLFLLNSKGVPSIAKFIQLQEGGTATTCAGRHTAPTAQPPAPAPTTTPTSPSTFEPPSTPPATPTRLSVALTPATRHLKASKRRYVKVRCRASDSKVRRSCKVTLRQLLSHKRTRLLGSGRATVPAGKRNAVVTVRLNALGRRLIGSLSTRKSVAVKVDSRVTMSGSKVTGTASRRYRLIR